MGDDEKNHVLELEDEYSCLVVDDSDFMVKNLERIISSFNCEVIGKAFNGQEAVDFVEENTDDIDFITLDITMPEMDGIEALEEILEIDPDMTVIMVSAVGKEKTVKKCISLGADHFIVKPFEREDIYEKLSAILE